MLWPWVLPSSVGTLAAGAPLGSPLPAGGCSPGPWGLARGGGPRAAGEPLGSLLAAVDALGAPADALGAVVAPVPPLLQAPNASAAAPASATRLPLRLL